ncbi:MAG: DUF1365 domain-containing protein [Pseudomonadota bacterium]
MLLQGKVMHARTAPKANRFEYDNLYFYLPLGFKEKLKERFFSFNRFNLFSFFDVDHNITTPSLRGATQLRRGNPEALKNKNWIATPSARNDDAKNQIEQIFSQNQISNIKNIILISHPRILGYAFNPASFWLGFDEEENLIAALVEVRNTFKQKHSYLLFNENLTPIGSNQWLGAKKEFHVSPFFENKGDYKFRFALKENQLDFYINYYVENQLQLATSLKCQYQELTDKNLILSLLKMPFLMFKTIFLIHLQAFKLWVFKGAKYHPLPPKLNNNLTVSKNAQT